MLKKAKLFSLQIIINTVGEILPYFILAYFRIYGFYKYDCKGLFLVLRFWD